MNALIFAAAVLSLGPLSDPPPTAVPVDQEPRHKLVLKNDFLEVLRVTLPAGQSTQIHTHAHDGGAIRLSEATISTDVPGKAGTPPRQAHPGDVSLTAYARQPLTHRVNNVGDTTFEVIDLEFLKRPDGPATRPIALPVAESERARVYRYSLAPGEATPMHTHERPYLIVAATPMQLGMAAPDGASMEHPIQAGDFHWVDRKVTHALANRSAAAGIIIEVELR